MQLFMYLFIFLKLGWKKQIDIDIFLPFSGEGQFVCKHEIGHIAIIYEAISPKALLTS